MPALEPVRVTTPQRDKRIYKVAAVLLATAFGGMAAEIVVRVLYGSPLPERMPLLTVRAHKTRGWEMMPSAPHYTYTHRVSVNGLGLRGPGPSQDPDVSNILALGDSLVYGQGVADDETIPFFLEHSLNAMGGRHRVVNGGVRGYSTNQELAEFEEMLPLIRPRIVVLFWFWNDFEETNIERTYNSLMRTGPLLFDVKANLSGLSLWKWRGKQLLRRSALIMAAQDVLTAKRLSPPTPDVAVQGIAKFAEYLNRFATLAQQNNTRLHLVLIPDPNSLKLRHPSESTAVEIRRVAEKVGVDSMDLLPALKQWHASQATSRLPVVPFDGHYSAAANRAMAVEVSRRLTASVRR